MSQNIRPTPDSPRHGRQLERGRVRLGDHVRLVDPGEPLDRGTVEADSLGERPLQFRGRHRDRLQETEHVREPQPDKTDVTLLKGPEHELFLPVHVLPASLVSGPAGRLRIMAAPGPGRIGPRPQSAARLFPAGYIPHPRAPCPRPALHRHPARHAASWPRRGQLLLLILKRKNQACAYPGLFRTNGHNFGTSDAALQQARDNNYL